MDEFKTLKKNNFVMKKRYGQNFISDRDLLDAITVDAEITGDDTVVEIGAGAGTLTSALSKKAKRVISFEIDTSLSTVLSENLSGKSNVEVIFKDILKTPVSELLALTKGAFKVVANLPYYITSPVLFYFLESDLPIVSLTVMVQKEVAQRMTAQPDTAEYGVLTLSVASRADAVITREVGRKMFFPVPNVDSAVVKLTMKEDQIEDRETFDRLVRCAFAARRKTLVNNLVHCMDLDKQTAEEMLAKLNIDIKVRGEALSLCRFIELSEIIKKYELRKNGCLL